MRCAATLSGGPAFFDELKEYLLSNINAFPRAPYQKLSQWIDSFIDIQDAGDTSIHALVEAASVELCRQAIDDFIRVIDRKGHFLGIVDGW